MQFLQNGLGELWGIVEQENAQRLRNRAGCCFPEGHCLHYSVLMTRRARKVQAFLARRPLLEIHKSLSTHCRTSPRPPYKKPAHCPAHRIPAREAVAPQFAHGQGEATTPRFPAK